MKKFGILSVILCVALLTACGGGNTAEAIASSISEAEASETTTDEAYMTTTETTTEETSAEAE